MQSGRANMPSLSRFARWGGLALLLGGLLVAGAALLGSGAKREPGRSRDLTPPSAPVGTLVVTPTPVSLPTRPAQKPATAPPTIALPPRALPTSSPPATRPGP